MPSAPIDGTGVTRTISTAHKTHPAWPTHLFGYVPHPVEEYVARYKINEKFMGMDAVELAIPSYLYS
jgi:hypothetical protein